MNLKIKIIVSYSKYDMDDFNDGSKIDFVVDIPMKRTKDKDKLDFLLTYFCSESARNLLIANDIEFREYMIRTEYLEKSMPV
ncbi:hypothetical protein AM2_091 [Lactococcus phage AM2]|uniref:Uncharacterized protein n=7 Tax=Audreyjarvisvirus AM1 TaxID=2845188 RepID=A0A1W6JLM2_9CAUD|nr:hypothetical protein H1Z30_gp092 [Lactococcus phage AM1]ARM66396.1 hypothetical protein AM2_091 [Lactococcus phage AM2]ARM66573.1 hypothetical protein AM3_091 [Lactococcus phage AM3]ARM67126.1 hypothetical protein AM8_091 [Lactococcus phage AM8]ARM67305.1 hypothetical protein AM9_092 [Lactococcus phage AM9]ARM67483.1 hypothetical protein AM11_091 [Lactococcus phage AM11]ARQ95671.1 hypothetical protein AM12_092 [Lactococcus phage AM12]